MKMNKQVFIFYSENVYVDPTILSKMIQHRIEVQEKIYFLNIRENANFWDNLVLKMNKNLQADPEYMNTC